LELLIDRSFIPWFDRSILPWFDRSILPSLVRSILPSLVRSIDRSFLPSFLPSLTPPKTGRNPSKLVIPTGSGGPQAGQPLTSPQLTVVAGDVTNAGTVDALFAKHAPLDGVVIALGGKTADVGDTMLTVGTQNVMNAMKKHNVKRVAVVTSIGTGDSKDQAPFFFKILMATAMSKIFKDKNRQEEVVQASTGIDYCIIRPGGLTVEPPTGVIHVIQGEAGSIARADVAQFCLDAVTVPDFPYLGQTPCISSVGGTSWVKDRSQKARGGVSA
jgi:hypothetical protein